MITASFIDPSPSLWSSEDSTTQTKISFLRLSIKKSKRDCKHKKSDKTKSSKTDKTILVHTKTIPSPGDVQEETQERFHTSLAGVAGQPPVVAGSASRAQPPALERLHANILPLLRNNCFPVLLIPHQ